MDIRHYTSFFFSSRRRHTSWPRDWSSDVCSSDLYVVGRHLQKPSEQVASLAPGQIVGGLRSHQVQAREVGGVAERSEERRVGKECGRGGGEGSRNRKAWSKSYTGLE